MLYPYLYDKKLVGDPSRIKLRSRIGEFFEGGYIFYESSIEHGIIVSDSIAPSTYTWADIGIAGTYADILKGAYNTNLILAGSYPPYPAASFCDTYNHNGYTDWFLPSVNELIELYKVLDKIPTVFPDNLFWSSTQNGNNFDGHWNAWAVRLAGSGNVVSDNEIYDLHVVACRYF